MRYPNVLTVFRTKTNLEYNFHFLDIEDITTQRKLIY